MPDIHVPRLEEDDDADERVDRPEPVVTSPPDDSTPAVPSAATAPVLHRSQGKSVLKIALEVVLISIGVFLGLLGEQWREHAQHHEIAQASLRRFRSELRANRQSVASVIPKHAAKLKDLQAYFTTHQTELLAHLADPRQPLPMPFPDTATDPAFFEYSAWDLALATQSLAYIDQDLAFSIAHVYRVQQQIDESTRAITQTMYSFSNHVAFLQGVATYFGDCTLLEPRLLRIYDDILPRLDRALGDGEHPVTERQQ